MFQSVWQRKTSASIIRSTSPLVKRSISALDGHQGRIQMCRGMTTSIELWPCDIFAVTATIRRRRPPCRRRLPQRQNNDSSKYFRRDPRRRFHYEQCRPRSFFFDQTNEKIRRRCSPAARSMNPAFAPWSSLMSSMAHPPAKFYSGQLLVLLNNVLVCVYTRRPAQPLMHYAPYSLRDARGVTFVGQNRERLTNVFKIKLEIRSVERGIFPIATSTMNELFL